VECTINGLGERAGNASLEEIVMAVQTRADAFSVATNINPVHIVPTSRLVSSITGFPVQPNKAIVGANAFAHESGIHQDGVLKHRETYEIMKAESVGWHSNKLVLGKHSGRAAVKARFEELGVTFATPDELNAVFASFKDLADKKHEIFDEDLQSLVGDVVKPEVEKKYQFSNLEATSKSGKKPVASMILTINGVEYPARAEGDGLVDAAFKAVEKIVNSHAQLKLYLVSAVTQGTDSIGDVVVRLEKDGVIVNGQGADTDVIVASIKAYLDALNLLDAGVLKSHPQKGI
jgi:2-isopropylmalate synthase